MFSSHRIIQLGLNKLQREMCQKLNMYIDGNKFNQNCYDLMETMPTHEMPLLFSIIQFCVNKIISQFSALNPISVFYPT